MNIFTRIYRKSKQFWQNKIILFTASTSLALIIIIWFAWIFYVRNVGPIYSPLTWAPESISDFLVPILSSAIFVINLFLAERAFKKEVLISYLLSTSSLFIQILVLILINFYISTG